MNIAKTSKGDYISIHSTMLNRHGMIAGATGTGKTVTVKKMAELLSSDGIPTFVVDVKGDLNGFVAPGKANEKFQRHVEKFGEMLPDFETYPVQFWDLFGKKGLPVRATISDMGPLLLSRLMMLNDVQSSIVQTLFKYADDVGLLLLDFKDFQSLIEYAHRFPEEIPAEYGAMNRSSLSAILRKVSSLDNQEVDLFFGERELDLFDLERQEHGKGVINILDATTLFLNPTLYSTFLLWLLSELYEQFEEAGDQEKPRMVFFFDEAHLIFDKISPVLLAQIEQVVRLIRSKGIGIFFVSQAATDLPDSVLSQLGNRIQHALRAYTAKEIKNLKLSAQGFRVNPELDIEKSLLALGVGEAIVSFLDEDGIPGISERAFIMPPHSQMGKVDGVDRWANSSLNQKYKEALDRESAFEILEKRVEKNIQETTQEVARAKKESTRRKKSRSTKRQRDSFGTKVGKSFLNSVSRRIGSSLARGLMGTLKKMK